MSLIVLQLSFWYNTGMNIDLANLIDECVQVEYKQEVCDGLFKTISAFSNSDGGCILLGIEDGTKNIVGIDLTDGKQEAIINRIADSTGIQPSVEHYIINNKNLLKITVEKSTNPIQYKGKYYKRVGNTTREATKEELKKLLLKDVSWDSQVNNCTIDDIDVDTVRNFLTLAVKKDRIIPEILDYGLEEILVHLDLIQESKLTNAAILLFGKNPQKLFRHATVRIGLFKGNDEDLIISDKEISGNLFNQIKETEIAVKSLINRKSSIKGFDRNEIWDYPIVALREAILNALIHREYSDVSSNTQIKIFDNDIWIYNTGDLFGGLTLEMLKNPHHPSKSRNPLIMNVIYNAGYVERFGTGIKRMTSACRKQCMPAPIFSIESFGFTLTMKKEYSGINDRQKQAINYIVQTGNSITNSIYQDLNNVSRETSKRDLKRLVDMNIFDSYKEKGITLYKIKA